MTEYYNQTATLIPMNDAQIAMAMDLYNFYAGIDMIHQDIRDYPGDDFSFIKDVLAKYESLDPYDTLNHGFEFEICKKGIKLFSHKKTAFDAEFACNFVSTLLEYIDSNAVITMNVACTCSNASSQNDFYGEVYVISRMKVGYININEQSAVLAEQFTKELN